MAGGVAGGMGAEEQKLIVERLRKEGAEWKQRAKEAELSAKKKGWSVIHSHSFFDL